MNHQAGDRPTPSPTPGGSSSAAGSSATLTWRRLPPLQGAPHDQSARLRGGPSEMPSYRCTHVAVVTERVTRVPKSAGRAEAHRGANVPVTPP